jgi:hypothetical protein
MKRSLLLLVTSVVTVACMNNAGPGDMVRTQDDAVAIARQACAALEPANFKDLWKAQRHGDSWSAWFSAGKFDGECGIYDVSIRAVDGRIWDGKSFVEPDGSDGCQLCVH